MSYPQPAPPRRSHALWWVFGVLTIVVLLLIAAAAVFLVTQRDGPSGALSDGQESAEEPVESFQLDEGLCPKIDWTALADFFPSDDDSWLDEVADADNDSLIDEEGLGTQWCSAYIEPRMDDADSVHFSLELQARDDPEDAFGSLEFRTGYDNDQLRDGLEADEIDLVDECDEAALRTELDTDGLALRDMFAGCRVGNLNVFVESEVFLADADSDVSPDEFVTEVAAPITSEVLRALTD